MKRAIAALLLLALMAGIFGGCAQTGEDNAPAPEKSGTGEISKQSPGSGGILKPLDGWTPGEKKEYTVLVYMVGSDLESQYGCASEDLEEMLSSGMDTERVNLVVYTGGSRSWELNVPSDRNTLWVMEDGVLCAAAATDASRNMGDQNTFADFLSYAHENFPAERYGLICWDHGGGPLIGYGMDELFSGDMLTTWEIEGALADSPFWEEPLEFLGFDACLMATIEVADMAAPYARYLIASEEVEPGSGWDYSFLSAFNTSSDTEEIARQILKTYSASLEAMTWNTEYTLSCLDLSRLPEALSAMDALFARMDQGVQEGDYSRIAQSRENTLRFSVSSSQDLSGTYDLVDLWDLARRLGAYYPEDAQALEERIDALVAAQVTNMTGAGGVSVYYPYDNKTLFENGGFDVCEYLCVTRSYVSFVARFSDIWINGEPMADWASVTAAIGSAVTGRDVGPEAAQLPDQLLTVQLTDAQMENLSSASYTIFIRSVDESTGEDVYTPVLLNCRVEPDESGRIEIPVDQSLMVLSTDTDESVSIWPVSGIPTNEANQHYISLNTWFNATGDTIGAAEGAQIFFADNGSSDEMEIRCIYSTNVSEAEVYGKTGVTLEDWDYIYHTAQYLYPTYDASHVLLPYTQWDNNYVTSYTMLPYDESFHIEKAELSDFEQQFCCQVVLTDTQGNTYGTQIVDFPYEQKYVEMEQNGMNFRVYEDHAELLSYQGTDPHPVIPDEVSGAPVTVIGPEAFYYNRDITGITLPRELKVIEADAFRNCSNLTEVIYNEALEHIGAGAFKNSGVSEFPTGSALKRLDRNAFAGTALTEVHLGSGIEAIGAGVFADCQSLAAITAEGNAFFRAADGMLLTADGKKILQFAAGSGCECVIPQGVEIICKEAFCDAENLTRVTFPEGLKEIDSYAFYNVRSLESIVLPDSLEVIGHNAFGTFRVSVNETSPVSTIVIGPGVRRIGSDAFRGYAVKGYTVAEDNVHFRSENGCLLNKSGTVFIQAPNAWEGKLEIPEGVSHIGWHALENCDGITELVLPDSVVSMDAEAGLPEMLTKLTVGKGMIRWENVTDCYYIPEVIISPDNPNYTMVDGSIFSGDLRTLLICRSSGEIYSVPEGVKVIGEDAFCYAMGTNETLKTIILPASVEQVTGRAFQNLRALEQILVAEGNSFFTAWDGLLYDKSGTVLIACPLGKAGTVRVREGTQTIDAYAFGIYTRVEEVILPEGVAAVRQGNFVSVYEDHTLKLHLPDSLTEIHPEMLRYPEKFVICCGSGSPAETFAHKAGAEVVNE